MSRSSKKRQRPVNRARATSLVGGSVSLPVLLFSVVGHYGAENWIPNPSPPSKSPMLAIYQQSPLKTLAITPRKMGQKL